MFECNLCQPIIEFESELAYYIHYDVHHKSSEQTINKVNDESKSIVNDESKNVVNEESNKLSIEQLVEEKKMGFFKKEEEIEEEKSYLYELHLEVNENDKKTLEVIEEINKTVINLMSKGYIVKLKKQKIEKEII